MGKRRKFTREFKLDAVRLIVEGERTIADVSRSLGVRDGMLSRWKQEFEADPKVAFRGQGRRTPQDEELERLRRKLEEVTEERDILKKAAAYFAKHQS
jgi:transposase